MIAQVAKQNKITKMRRVDALNRPNILSQRAFELDTSSLCEVTSRNSVLALPDFISDLGQPSVPSARYRPIVSNDMFPRMFHDTFSKELRQ